MNLNDKSVKIAGKTYISPTYNKDYQQGECIVLLTP